MSGTWVWGVAGKGEAGSSGGGGDLGWEMGSGDEVSSHLF